jgi:hypothetical protein
VTAAQFPDDMTLGRARELLRELAADGHECPACGQHCEIYERPLNSVAVRAVIALWRVHDKGFGHLPTVAREHLADVQGQGGYLVLGQHWDLIEEERRVRPDGGRAGYWRVTDLGEAFIHGRRVIPSHVRLYDGHRLGYADRRKLVNVDDVLSKNFDLAELLGPTAGARDPDGEQARLFVVADTQPAATYPSAA